MPMIPPTNRFFCVYSSIRAIWFSLQIDSLDSAQPNRQKKTKFDQIPRITLRSLFVGLMAWKEYAEFEEKVKRTVLLDNLSPQATSSVVETALGQFGNVLNVEFIPNYTIPYNIPQCALVEMETQKQAKAVVNDIANYPFMMCGMPRPVMAQPAAAEMFSDRPSQPDMKMQVRWVDPSEPDFEVGKQLKLLCRKHTAETFALIKATLDEEEELANKQEETLKANYKKYEMIESIMKDGSAPRLAHKYGFNLALDDDA